MNAAQSARYQCLSPFAVFDELEELVRGVTVYEFLKQEPLPGGFHENRKFIFQVRDKLIDKIDDEVRTSMGLVEERRYIEQFERYVTHVSYWVKHEKVPNPITGRDEDPDEEMMAEVERILEVTGAPRRVPPRGHQPHRRLVDRSPAAEARLRADLPAPDRRAARVVLRGAQEAGPQDQRGPAGLPHRRSGQDAARRGGGGRRDAGDAEVPLRLLRQLREGRGPGADPQALQLTTAAGSEDPVPSPREAGGEG